MRLFKRASGIGSHRGSTDARAAEEGACGSAAAAAGLCGLAFAASLLTAPLAVAHDAMMEHGTVTDATAAAASTAASRFSCTPVDVSQRLAYFADDVRGFTHKIHTSSPRAQQLFDEGLVQAFNFNHPEAIKDFQLGLAEDPSAAMMHWGIVHSLGPYANKVWGAVPADMSYPVMTPDELQQAQQAAKAGVAVAAANLAADPSDPLLRAELAYLSAADRLYGSMSSSDDPAFTEALARYAAELEVVAADNPADADAPALAAAARMNTSPWVHWVGPITDRQPYKADTVVTPALADIAVSLERRPGHPLAAHLLIHLTEAGRPGSSRDMPLAPGFAALGEAGADILTDGLPFGRFGHLTHMPSHTYIRVGRWHDAVHANQLALQADEAQAKLCIEPYMPGHNAAMLQFAAMMSGEYEAAQQAAQRMVAYPEIFGPTLMSDGRERVALPLLHARFANWDPLLQLQRSDLDHSSDGVMVPPGTDAFSSGVFHYVRLLALASAASHAPSEGGRAELLSQAQAELAGLQAAVAATPADPITKPGDGLGIYSPGFKVLGEIGETVARARLDVLTGDLPAAAGLLQDALERDGRMGYTEPPRQSQPIRHCLGWVLLQQGDLTAAEQVYRDDLAELPGNAWALTGLKQVLQAQGVPPDQIKQVDAALQDSWSHADPGLTLNSSCPAFSD